MGKKTKTTPEAKAPNVRVDSSGKQDPSSQAEKRLRVRVDRRGLTTKTERSMGGQWSHLSDAICKELTIDGKTMEGSLKEVISTKKKRDYLTRKWMRLL